MNHTPPKASETSVLHVVEPKIIRRLTLRETRSGREALAIVSAAILFLSVVWLALELMLSASGNKALLISPPELLRRVASLAADTLPGALLAAGLVLILLGIGYLAAALLPGCKPRSIVADPRSAVVIDNEVLAAAVSRVARQVARLAPGQVTSSVGRRGIEVTLLPVSGREVDSGLVRETVEREVSGYALRRALPVTVTTHVRGAVGA